MKAFSWKTVLWIAVFAAAQAKATSPSPAVPQTPDVTVSGRIIVDEGVPLPLPAISFVQGERTRPVTDIQRDGTFRVRLPAGDYTVGVTSIPSGYFLRSLRQGSVDLRSNPLKLTGALQELQIDIGLSVPRTFVRVSGQVSGSDTLPTFGTNSVLLTRDPRVMPVKAPIRMDGRFEFPQVLPGDYVARVVEAGEGPITGAIPVMVRVEAGSDIAGLVLTVQVPVVITGHIQVEGQAPPPYLSLFFAGTDGRSFSSDLGNERGILKAQVLPGEYRVRVLSLSEGYTVTGVTKDAVDILSGTLRVAPDTPLDLAIGVRSSSKVVSVSGRVIRASNEDPPPGTITLVAPLTTISTSAAPRPRAIATAVRPDGSFELTNVTPGSYLIVASFDEARRGDYLTTMLHEPQPLVVGDAGVAGVEVRVPRHVRMTARFAFEGEGPRARPSIDIQYVITGPSYPTLLSGLRPNPDGTAGMILPEGMYRLIVGTLPPGYNVKSILQAGKDVLNQPFLLSAVSSEFVVVVDTSAPLRRVRGRIIDAPNPGSTSSVSVKLFSTDFLELETTVGPGGRFEFQKVPPGSYGVSVESAYISVDLVTQIAIGDAPPGEPRITVKDSDIEDLRITRNGGMAAFVGLGRLIVEGGGPMPRFLLTFNGGGGGLNPSPVDGTFQGWMPVGTSKVEISGMPKEYVLKSVTYGETNLRETELVLHATDANANLLRIVVAPSGIPWKRVAGRLTGLENLGGEPARLSISSLTQTVDTAVMPDGSFEFPQVLSGTFTAGLEIGNPATHAGLRIQIVVADENILQLELPVPRPLTLSITTDEGNLPSDLLHLRVARRDSDNRWLDYLKVDGTSRGFFAAGDRVEIRQVPSGYRVKAVTLGTIDLLKEAIRFDNPSATQISIVLEPAPPDPQNPEFTLKGRVQSAANPARRRVTATYVGRQEMLASMMETFVRDDGSFEFDRVPAGPYEIRIVGRQQVYRFVVPDDSGIGAILSLP